MGATSGAGTANHYHSETRAFTHYHSETCAFGRVALSLVFCVVHN